MKIVNIIGGLGNQMFQYAFALALKQRFPQEEVKIDVSSYGTYNLHNGLEIDRIFDVSLPFATKAEIKRLSYHSDNYKIGRYMQKLLPRRKTTCHELPLGRFDRRDLFTHEDKYYEGYWQNYQYFDMYREEIRKAFRFKLELPAAVEALREEICSVNSVCIHVRRGDYLLHKLYRGCCESDYYQRAIEYIHKTESEPHFFIFSNDIEWCKENIVDLLGSHYTFVECNRGADSYRDMQLMTCAKRLIIANSSFSWWGAYLNRNEDVKVIAPVIWSNNNRYFDRQLPTWIRL
jgi:hypothetical protein